MARVGISPELVDRTAEIEFDSKDLEERVTIVGYLQNLLLKVIEEGSEFNPQKPFGFVDWKDQLYIAMIRNGVVDGALDDDGFIDEFDQRQSDLILSEIVTTYLDNHRSA